jgi:hypothetical protein
LDKQAARAAPDIHYKITLYHHQIAKIMQELPIE